jgi:hypothetical protein
VVSPLERLVTTKKNNRIINRMSGLNIWKILAITFITIFFIILGTGFLRAYHHQKLTQPVTSAQKELVNQVVINDLQEQNIETSKLISRISQRVRMHPATNKKTIQATIQNETIMMIYTIDAETGEIVIRTQTHYRSWKTGIHQKRKTWMIQQ